MVCSMRHIVYGIQYMAYSIVSGTPFVLGLRTRNPDELLGCWGPKYLGLTVNKAPESHINAKILHSGPRAQDTGDSRSYGL